MIPKNAYIHGLNGILDMWRKPLNCEGNTQYCLTALKQYLAKLHKSLSVNDFSVEDRNWLLEENRSFEDIVHYLSDWADIEYYEDDFNPKYFEHYGNYPQKYKSSLMLADAYRGGLDFPVTQMIRCINDDQGKRLRKTVAHAKLTKDLPISKLGKDQGVKEHRYPINVTVQRLVDEVYDIRHASRLLSKRCEMIWATNGQDKIIDKEGLTRRLPPCGTDRYEYLSNLGYQGFEIAA